MRNGDPSAKVKTLWLHMLRKGRSLKQRTGKATIGAAYPWWSTTQLSCNRVAVHMPRINKSSFPKSYPRAIRLWVPSENSERYPDAFFEDGPTTRTKGHAGASRTCRAASSGDASENLRGEGQVAAIHHPVTLSRKMVDDS
jgi:hypothetical protein